MTKYGLLVSVKAALLVVVVVVELSFLHSKGVLSVTKVGRGEATDNKGGMMVTIMMDVGYRSILSVDGFCVCVNVNECVCVCLLFEKGKRDVWSDGAERIVGTRRTETSHMAVQTRGLSI